MIILSFDLALWTVLFFVVGMIKPRWPLFFMKNPDRFTILIISTVLLMITVTLWGEGNRREKKALEAASASVKNAPVQAPTPAPVPVPEVLPAKAK